MFTRRKAFILLSVIFGMILALFFFLENYLPIFLERNVLPKIEDAGGFDLDCEIRKVGIFSSEIEDIRIKRDGRTIFESDQIRLKYLFWALAGIKEIQVRGLRLRLDEGSKSDVKKSGGVISELCSSLNGARGFMSRIGKEFQGQGRLLRLLDGLRVKVSGGELCIFNADGKKKIIPFEFTGNLDGKNIVFNIFAEPFSGGFFLSGKLDSDFTFSTELNWQNISLSDLSADFSGQLQAKALSGISERELEFGLDCEIRNFNFKRAGIHLLSIAEKPLKINLFLRGEQIEFSVRGLSQKGFAQFEFEFLNGKIGIREKSIEFSADISVLSAEETENKWGKFELSGFPVLFALNGELSDGLWRIRCEKKSEKKVFIAKIADMNLSSEITDFMAEITGGNTLDGNLVLKTGESRLSFKDSELTFPSIESICEIRDGAYSGFAKIAGGFYRKGVIDVSGINGIAKFAKGEVVNVEAEAGKILINGKDYGQAKICGGVGGDGFEARGKYLLSAIGYELPFEISGNFGGKEKVFSLKASNKDYESLKRFNLGAMVDTLAGFSCEGALKIFYHLEMKGAVLSSFFEKKLKDFSIENKDSGVKISGLEGYFSSEDPAFLKSLPSQKMSARELVFGKNKLSNLELVYTLEGPKSFFIEKLDAIWCGGNIHMFASRIDQAKRKVFTLYFDRILLSEILNEFGVCEGSGDGRVNGRIPVVLDGENIEFKDAFFYSSPGVGGNIKVSKAGAFMSGIPTQGEQFSSIDLTLEALKDFNYDWSKISINSEGDDILAKVEFLGRPSRPLPFRFDRRTGGFSRVEGESAGSKFEEIKLDLNCRFPFNAIMRYIKVFKGFLQEKGVK